MTGRTFACIAGLLAAAGALGACSRQDVDEAPPVATPSVELSRHEAAVGSPVDVTYRFAMRPDAAKITDDLWVFVHVLDTDGELLWTDDHQPPTSTREWQPGKTVEYARTMFVPKLPFVGDARLEVGVFSPKTGERLPLGGENRGMRSYQVATLSVRPQRNNLFVVFRSGWHDAEVGDGGPGVEWQWTRGNAVLSFRNPRQNVEFFLDTDSIALPDPQKVEVRIGTDVIDAFTIAGGPRQIRRVKLSADQLGTADTVEVAIAVDKPFVPAAIPQLRSSDARELGIRVFRAHIEPE